MNKKVVLIIVLIVALAFGAGWFIGAQSHHEACVKDKPKQIDSLKDEPLNTVTISQFMFDSLITKTHDTSVDFSTKLKGRFVLRDAEYAGFNFYSRDRITWTNEMDAWHPDSLRIRWINNTTFYTRNIQQLNEKCPPKVEIYQVVYFDGHHLILGNPWTGWGKDSDSHLEFYRNDTLED